MNKSMNKLEIKFGKILKLAKLQGIVTFSIEDINQLKIYCKIELQVVVLIYSIIDKFYFISIK